MPPFWDEELKHQLRPYYFLNFISEQKALLYLSIFSSPEFKRCPTDNEAGWISLRLKILQL